MVRDLPHISQQREIGPYHAKLNHNGPELEVVPMTLLDYYLTPMEYEVFGIGTLMRDVEFARASYDHAFNRRYSFKLDSVFPHLRRSEVYIIRSEVKPYILSTRESPSAPLSGIDVTIKTRGFEFIGRRLVVGNGGKEIERNWCHRS